MASLFLLKAIFFKIQMNGLIFKFYELLLKGLSFAEKNNSFLRIKFYFLKL
jgi:hypothetical protein